MATTQGTKEPEGAANAGKLSAAEVKDDADSARRAPEPDLKGKRVRAIPYSGGTTVQVRRQDFKLAGGPDHPTVVWDFRKDKFTVGVGDKLSQEAADFLVENYPESFEYIND